MRNIQLKYNVHHLTGLLAMALLVFSCSKTPVTETQKEQTHFLNIAYGSLMEIYSQLDVACDLGYITNQEFEQMEVMVNEEAKMLAGMIKKRKESYRG